MGTNFAFQIRRLEAGVLDVPLRQSHHLRASVAVVCRLLRVRPEGFRIHRGSRLLLQGRLRFRDQLETGLQPNRRSHRSFQESAFSLKRQQTSVLSD